MVGKSIRPRRATQACSGVAHPTIQQLKNDWQHMCLATRAWCCQYTGTETCMNHEKAATWNSVYFLQGRGWVHTSLNLLAYVGFANRLRNQTEDDHHNWFGRNNEIDVTRGSVEANVWGSVALIVFHNFWSNSNFTLLRMSRQVAYHFQQSLKWLRDNWCDIKESIETHIHLFVGARSVVFSEAMWIVITNLSEQSHRNQYIPHNVTYFQIMFT